MNLVNKKSKLLQRLKKWVMILLISALTLFLLLFVTAWVMEKRVKSIVVNELNKHLIPEVKVDDIELSLIKKFPYASLNFKNLQVPSLFEGEEDLLTASGLYLKFSIFDLFRGEYVAKKVELNDAKLHLKRNKNGDYNYEIWKTTYDSTATDTSDFRFDLRKVSFNNVIISYTDVPNDILVSVTAKKSSLSGQFSRDIYKMSLKGDMIINKLKIDESEFFTGQYASTDILFNVNRKTEEYLFEKGHLVIEGLPFDVSGVVNDASGIESVDLFIKGDGINLDDFITLLPDEYNHYFEQYEYDGSFGIQTQIKGGYSNGNLPVVKINFGISNAGIKHIESGVQLSGVTFKGEYSSSGKGGQLLIKDFYAQLGQGQVNGFLQIIDLTDPKMKVVIRSELDLNSVASFLPNDDIKSMDGVMGLNFSMVAQPGKDYSFNDYSKIKTSGELLVKNASFTLNNDSRRYSKINGKFLFSNSDLIAKDFKLNVNNSDFRIQGYFRNLIPRIFSKDETFEVKADLFSSNFALEDLMQSESEIQPRQEALLSFPNNVNLVFNLHINKFTYGRFNSQNIKGKLELYNKKLYANGLSMQTMDGNASATGLISQLDNGHFKASCEAQFAGIDAKKLFWQFNNFGQTSLLSSNIAGKVTAKISFMAQLDQNLEVLLPTVAVNSEVIIHDGEMINYEPIEYLAKYIRVSDLSHIKFSTLKNQIRIENEKIIIPEMLIKSDACNLSISGIQYFDGRQDYHLKILLSEIISNKARKANRNNNEFGEVEEDGLGRITLYLLIGGTIDEPTFKYDKKGLKEKIKTDLQKEKQDLKRILQEEFGIFKDQKEKEKTNDNGIVIEWDDE